MQHAGDAGYSDSIGKQGEVAEVPVPLFCPFVHTETQFHLGHFARLIHFDRSAPNVNVHADKNRKNLEGRGPSRPR